MNLGQFRFGAAFALTAGLAVSPFWSDATAASYSVEVNPILNGLDVKIEPVAQEGMLFIKLTNKTDAKVRCDLQYNAAPELPHRTSEFVQPGKDATSSLMPTRKWHAVSVDVKCVPSK